MWQKSDGLGGRALAQLAGDQGRVAVQREAREPRAHEFVRGLRLGQLDFVGAERLVNGP